MFNVENSAIYKSFHNYSKSEQSQNGRVEERTQAAIQSILEQMPRIQNLPPVKDALNSYVSRHQSQESWGGWIIQGAAKAAAKTSYGTDFNRDIVTPYRESVVAYVRASTVILNDDKELLIDQMQKASVGKLDNMENRSSLDAVTNQIEGIFKTILQTEQDSLQQAYLQEEKAHTEELKSTFFTEIEHCVTEAKKSKYEMYSGEQPSDEYTARMATFTKAMHNVSQFDQELPLLKNALEKQLKGQAVDLPHSKLDSNALNAMIWALSYFSHLRSE